MTLSPLQAISPIDGRYRKTTAKLANYFSEYALIKYRVFVEVEYFIALCEAKVPGTENFDSANFSKLRAIYENFTDNRIINNTPALCPNIYISNDDWGANDHNFTFSKNIATTGNVE